MWFSFEMSFHFQNVKGFMVFFFLFPKNTIVNKNLQTKICTVTTNSFTDEVVLNNNEIYIRLLNLFQLSRTYCPNIHTVTPGLINVIAHPILVLPGGQKLILRARNIEDCFFVCH